MAFHAEGVGRTPAQSRSEKERRVREGRAHAALVYDGPTCVGCCQFGPTDEMPRIKHRRTYLEAAAPVDLASVLIGPPGPDYVAKPNGISGTLHLGPLDLDAIVAESSHSAALRSELDRRD
jgi:hypothetical protein